MKVAAVHMAVVHIIVEVIRNNIRNIGVSGKMLTRDFFRCYNRTQEVIRVISLNEQIKKYMIKFDWKHIVLNIEKFTS